MNRIQQNSTFLLYLVCISAFLASLTQNIYSPILPILRDSFQVSLTWINASVSLFMFILSIMQIIWGPLIDSKGAKKILLPSIILTLIGSIGCAITSHFGFFLFFRGVQALGTAAIPLIAGTTIGHIFEGSARGKAMGTYQTTLSFAPAVSPVLGGFIGSKYGYSGIFWFLVIISIVLLFINARYFPAKHAEKENDSLNKKTLSTSRSYKQILKNKLGLSIIIIGFIHFFIYFAILVYLPLLFTEHYHLELELVGLLYLPMAVSTIVGSWLYKRVQHRVPRTVLLFTGSLLTSVFILLFALTSSSSLIGMSFVLVLYGISSGFTLPVHTTLLTEQFPSSRGTALGLYNFIRYMGMAAGPVVYGLILPIFSPMVLFILLGLFFAITAFVLLKWEGVRMTVRSFR